MKTDPEHEQEHIRTVAPQNAPSIPGARPEAEGDLLVAKKALERKTQELTDSLALVKATLDSTMDGILVIRPTGEIVEINEKFLSLWDVSRASITEQKFQTFIEGVSRHFLNSEAFSNRMQEIVETDLGDTADLFELQDGRVFECFSKKQTLADNRELRVWSFRDVTSRHGDIAESKRVEKALRESETSLAAAQARAHLGSWELDLKTLQGAWSAEMARLHGHDPALTPPTFAEFLELVHPEDRASILEVHANLPSATAPVTHEYRSNPSAGPVKDFSVTMQVLRDDAGHPERLVGTTLDISERKLAENSLRESEERFRTMANSMPQLAWIARADGFIFWYNQRWYEYTGTHPEQMEGWGWQSVHDPAVLPQVMEKWQTAIALGEPFEMEFPLLRADGQFRTFLTRGQPLTDAEGKVVQWFGTNTDVEELKQMEASLRATQTRLNSTLSAGEIGTWTWDIINDCLVADEFTARAFSLEIQEAAQGLPSASFFQAIVEEDQPKVSEILNRAIESCGNYDIECRVRKKGGEILWLQARGRTEGDAAGKAMYFHGAVMDVTARKLAEAVIRESEEHFRFLDQLAEATRTLVDPGRIMAVVARMLGEHLQVSRCAYADVGKDGDAFTIQHDYTDGCASTVGQYQLSLFGPRAVATLHAGETLIIRNVNEELSAEDGADMFNAIGIQAIITCPLVKLGGLRAMMAVHQLTPRDWKPEEISIVQDVVARCWETIERRSVEEKIYHLNATLEERVLDRTAQLESANKELEAFSYSVSHDLRAPLRAVDGFSQAVLEDYGEQLPPEGQRYLKTIREGAQRMGALIDDLLTFSRLSRATLMRQSVDLEQQVKITLQELKTEQGEREIEFKVGKLPFCAGDPALLLQVWRNLLSNAVKYTSKREKAVVEIGSREGNATTIYFVRDNGTGFDMRYAGKLFGVFQRLHRQEEFSGTGVGLAIVQRIIHRHGGRIWAEAELDRGATFYFTLHESETL